MLRLYAFNFFGNNGCISAHGFLETQDAASPPMMPRRLSCLSKPGNALGQIPAFEYMVLT